MGEEVGVEKPRAEKEFDKGRDGKIAKEEKENVDREEEEGTEGGHWGGRKGEARQGLGGEGQNRSTRPLEVSEVGFETIEGRAGGQENTGENRGISPSTTMSPLKDTKPELVAQKFQSVHQMGHRSVKDQVQYRGQNWWKRSPPQNNQGLNSTCEGECQSQPLGNIFPQKSDKSPRLTPGNG
ncbi:hypothetical protein Pcinc_029054 [Petrolisthes cinctipes]|uniref:Uncharacterized protein n=1 Tax=Petrolisthes cinctipes TaxID=88211 RepID=A0AAE1K8E8_PETCI|nr:hypothetical protein Pcinc_029054 [Petrolisthes cinctipes]